MTIDDESNSPESATRYWMFQAIPEEFELVKALKPLPLIRWRVKKFKKEIRSGDRVYFWLAGKQGGIAGRGTVVVDPRMMQDSPEELRYVHGQRDDVNRLMVAVRVDAVFELTLTRESLKAHSRLASLSILAQSQGTNFRMTSEQAAAIDAAAVPAVVDPLAAAYDYFLRDPVERLYVSVRRFRAMQLKAYFADPDSIDLDDFERNVWRLESSTVVYGESVSLFEHLHANPALAERVAAAIDDGSIELHGNYIWKPYNSLFDTARSDRTPADKLTAVRTAVRELIDVASPPIEKARRIAAVTGFGFSTATALVMALHPTEFAIWNRQSKGAFEKLGLPHETLEAFQEAVQTLKERLNATDFIELDWFLYRANNGQVELRNGELYDKMLGDLDDLIEQDLSGVEKAGVTEKPQVVKARVGQGVFRDAVLALESACRVTGIDDPQFLIASHIQPWRSSDDDERLDGENGLALTPNVDRLFDRGFISFEDDGTLLIADEARATTLRLLGSATEGINCGSFSKRQRVYLDHHRRAVFRRGRDV